ncbi:unnamed protein product [Echinostoma caproni]|uniref:RT_RNaseH_2 domain-containing protein n=1 Tax=Echinostoma caproni TaxID=27848 RepID=A0A183ANH8_9TREM|nr:unnamed protein product [Echinostoma caproni]
MSPVLFAFRPKLRRDSSTTFAAQSIAEWKWTAECERILLEIIQMTTDQTLLASFFSMKHPTMIPDASDVGIGAVFEQDGRPIVCISRLLNTAERGYPQTQKETLAVYSFPRPFWLRVSGRASLCGLLYCSWTVELPVFQEGL